MPSKDADHTCAGWHAPVGPRLAQAGYAGRRAGLAHDALAGGDELLAHAEDRLGVRAGGTTEDGVFTLEETECLADCDVAPCVQVNHRYVRTTTADALDALLAELQEGGRTEEIPTHGTLIRVQRTTGLTTAPEVIAAERAARREETGA